MRIRTKSNTKIARPETSGGGKKAEVSFTELAETSSFRAHDVRGNDYARTTLSVLRVRANID